MPTLPIPIFVAMVLFFASLQLWRNRASLDALVVLLMLCAAQSLIIALNQHYGVPLMRQFQPLVASLIPACAWLAYRNQWSRSALFHLLGPGAVLCAPVVSPSVLDFLVPGLFAGYGVSILISARTGPDSQPNALLASGDLPARIWVFIGAALAASALSDVLIVAAHIADRAELQGAIVSIFSVGTLLIIGTLSLSPHLPSDRDEEAASDAVDGPEPVLPPRQIDPELWERLNSHMVRERPHLDPDLTLTRLARQLGVPAKTLSATINQMTGDNVSRFVNKARIDAAQNALREGESITNAMLISGFNTKSNFNREFLRIVGQSPTAWLNKTKPKDQS